MNHRKVTFHNRYGITLAADLYEPKVASGKLAAIAVCGPFGAVKEQAAVDFLSVQENVNPEKIVLIIHGEKAHSCYFSRDAYAAMVKDNPYSDNKELLIIPDAVHTDLYGGGGKDMIPFDKLEQFFMENMK